MSLHWLPVSNCYLHGGHGSNPRVAEILARFPVAADFSRTTSRPAQAQLTISATKNWPDVVDWAEKIDRMGGVDWGERVGR